MLEIAVHITQILLAVGAAGSVYRVYKGPSVLDRVISLDVMLVIVASMTIVDMVVNNHQDFIMFVVITAVIGFLGAVAIARYVVVRSPEEVAGDAPEQDPYPEPPVTAALPGAAAETEPEAPHDPVGNPRMPGLALGEGEDESTSWFSALTRSGFTPRRHDDDAKDATAPSADTAALSADTAAAPPAQRPHREKPPTQEDRDV